MAFLTGGRASGHDLGDLITQLLALPLLAWAVFALHATPGSPVRRAAIALALFIVALLALQQLPLPDLWLQAVPVRAALARDLQAAGVVDAVRGWSLSPLDSERGLWSVLPALAAFLGALALPARRQRNLLLLLVGLGAVSTALAFLQTVVPQDSLLNPYPEQSPKFGGLFAHFNHQATLMGLCVVIIAALQVDRGDRADPRPISRSAAFALVVLGVFMFAALPLTGSRAMFSLTAFGVVAVLWLRRRDPGAPRWLGLKARASDLLLGSAALAVAVVAIAWLRVDATREVRLSAAKATVVMARENAPYGAGLGSFVSWFNRAAPESLRLQPYYQNHAHNEYVQWWFESGAGALLAIAGVFTLLLVCYPRRNSPLGEHGVVVAAWLGCILILLHSWVDYPLRTSALMTAGGLLVGIVVAQHSRSSRVKSPSD